MSKKVNKKYVYKCVAVLKGSLACDRVQAVLTWCQKVSIDIAKHRPGGRPELTSSWIVLCTYEKLRGRRRRGREKMHAC